MTHMLKTLSLTIFFAIFLHASTITLDSKMKGLKTFSQVSFYEDTTKKMGIEDIKSKTFKIDYTIHSSQGASKSNWWIKFEVQNPKNEPIDWILKFNHGQFDELQSWQYKDKNILLSHSLKGDHYIDESRISLAERSSFEFITSAKEKNTVYVKLAYIDGGIMEMFHSIWTKNEFVKSQELRFNLLVGIISALSILLFYNIFILFILRKKEYFWYSTYLIGVILFILTWTQLGAHYLWSRSLYIIDMMPFASVVIIFVSFILFTREFLETFKHLPKVDKILKILVAFTLMGLVLANFGMQSFAIGIFQINTLSFIFFPIIGYILWYRGYKIARGYTIASFVLSTTIIISLLRFSEIIETSEFLFWISRFGFVAEGILLSIALADRITLLEQDTKSAQDKVRHTLEQAKQTLEAEVIKRTLELKKQTKKAEELARTDEMTGIANRRAFLEKGEGLVQHGIRYKAPFSLVLIDIDHFKHVNDKHGHEAGDLVLKLFAKEISESIRDTDFFARVGGEEFVILLPNTRSDVAVEKTKKLLKHISELEVTYKAVILNITASMGICEFTQPDDTIYSLLSKADQALYYVKEHGRNNVHLYLEN